MNFIATSLTVSSRCVIVLGLLLGSLAFGKDEEPLPPQTVFEDFSSYNTGAFPGDWKVRGWKQKALRVYSIKEEAGNKFLHATDHGEDMMIGKYDGWDYKAYPVLSFRWRALTLPKGAAENNSKTNDSACGIYLVFKDGIVFPKTIKYVWSSTLPVSDADVSYKDYFKTLIIQTGPERLNQWVTHEVNFVEQYKKYFNTQDVPKVQGIGVLTDANAMASVAECDYDDFVLRDKLSGVIAANQPSLVVNPVATGTKETATKPKSKK